MSDILTIDVFETWRSAGMPAKASGSAITTGTVNYFLKALTGVNAGKWWKNSDQTWAASETANAMTHQADGGWTINLAASPFVTAGQVPGDRYYEYAKESGDLHVAAEGCLVKAWHTVPFVVFDSVNGPTNTWTELAAVLAVTGVRRVLVAPGSTLTLSGSVGSLELFGCNWTLALNDATVTYLKATGATITGQTAALPSTLECDDCVFMFDTLGAGDTLLARRCALYATLNLDGNNVTLLNCRGLSDAVTINFRTGGAEDSQLHGTGCQFNDLTITGISQGDSDDFLYLEGTGDITFDDTNTLVGGAEVHGDWRLTDEAAAGVVTNHTFAESASITINVVPSIVDGGEVLSGPIVAYVDSIDTRTIVVEDENNEPIDLSAENLTLHVMTKPLDGTAPVSVFSLTTGGGGLVAGGAGGNRIACTWSRADTALANEGEHEYSLRSTDGATAGKPWSHGPFSLRYVAPLP